MKFKIELLILVSILNCACAAGISRTGYSIPQDQVLHSDSHLIPIKKDFVYVPSDAEVLGMIRARDTGFSTKCNEYYVLNVFRNDAATIGADLVNIVNEKLPSIWVTCYQATAELIRFRDRAKLAGIMPDDRYAVAPVDQRSSEADRKMRMIFPSARVGGTSTDTIPAAAAEPKAKR